MLAKSLAKQVVKRGAVRALPSVSNVVVRCSGTYSAENSDTVAALINELSSQQMETSKEVVPWFMDNMPKNYFETVDSKIRKEHLKAVAAFRDLPHNDMTLKIESTGADGSTVVTYFNDGPQEGLLQKNIANLVVPSGFGLASVKLFSAKDNTLSVQMFNLKKNNVQETAATREDAAGIFALAAEIRAGEHSGNSSIPSDSPLFSEESLTEYMTHCTPAYAKLGNPRRFLIQRKMYEKIQSSDKCEVHVEPAQDGTRNSWITVAAANVLPEYLFKMAAKMLGAFKFNVLRSHMDRVEDPANSTPELPGFVTMLRLYVNMEDATPETKRKVIMGMKRMKWLDEMTVDLGMHKHSSLGLDRAEIVTCLCSMLHGPLCKSNSHAFSSIASIVDTIDSDRKFIEISGRIADLFLGKFNPDQTMNEGEIRRVGGEIRDRIDHANPYNSKLDLNKVNDAKEVLHKMLDAVDATLRTNFFMPDRYALSLRLKAEIMATGDMGKVDNKPIPYGIYFSHGRNFNAFHCRFRDIARGGLRIVTPANSDIYASESSKFFDEVYNLAFAQQLKNKDIPEGGAKSVVLVNTPAVHKDARFFSARKSIRAFVDSCFDLTVKESVDNLVDYLKRDEILFFGPDEQCIPSDVEWITKRAAQRGYPMPAAFMSSKPGPGFNHKEFGVTSEGIVVFLDVALRKSLKIDPKKEKFSVKITGGPDGDVAGNLMKILIRDYANTVKIVAVADGFGVAEDPNGLDHGEIMRLFEAGSPINAFNKDKLSSEGCMFDASTEEGAARRDSMVFRVKSDVFVPGGGRPGTINKDNWMNFMDANDVPTSPLIVEGANLFNTHEAREGLRSKGVAIVKDSSANKCGVQCSSYEIQSSMILSEEEFMKHKSDLIADVLVKLREAGNNEAELLFREYANYPGSLPSFSERISNAINKVTDAIYSKLEDLPKNDQLVKSLLPLVKENMPKKLAELGWHAVPDAFPLQYQKCAMASTLASKLVYQEGIHLVEAQPPDLIAERAINYYFSDIHIKSLVADLEKKDLGVSATEKEEILSLLRKGGARTAMDIF